MSTFALLAAAPDAIAPPLAAFLALAAFLVGVPVFITDSPQPKKVNGSRRVEDIAPDQPLEDQVGA